MIFIMRPDGTIMPSIPSPVYQGADGTNVIYLFAPSMVGNSATVAFRTPDGVWTERLPMTQVAELPEEFAKHKYCVWQYTIDAPIARLDGVVTVQFFFYGNGALLPSSASSFVVGKGVPVILPQEPSQDVYEQILQAISAIQKSQQYGDYAARAIFEWRKERVDGAAISYGIGEFTYVPAGVEGGPKGSTGSFIKSLVDNNTQPPYVDGELNSAYWWEIVNFDYLYEYYFRQLSGLTSLAESYKDAAETAQEGALTAKEEAETAQEGAVTAREAAETAETGARESAQSAAVSESNAAASERNAAAYEQGAQTAEQRAIEAQDAAELAAGKAEEFAKLGTQLDTRVKVIEGKIAPDASADNPLETKSFINSSINNLAAFFITPTADGDKAWASRAALLAAITFYSGGKTRVPTQNDYAIVIADESQSKGVDGTYPTTRYSYQGGTYPTGQWEFQYIVNNTSLTQAQVDALNSGITSAGVGQIATNKNDITSLKAKNDEQDTAIKKAQDAADGAAQLSDLNGYVKADGSTVMTGKLTTNGDGFAVSAGSPTVYGNSSISVVGAYGVQYTLGIPKAKNGTLALMSDIKWANIPDKPAIPSIPNITITNSGSGNVVSDITASGHNITVKKTTVSGGSSANFSVDFISLAGTDSITVVKNIGDYADICITNESAEHGYNLEIGGRAFDGSAIIEIKVFRIDANTIYVFVICIDGTVRTFWVNSADGLRIVYNAGSSYYINIGLIEFSNG